MKIEELDPKTRAEVESEIKRRVEEATKGDPRWALEVLGIHMDRRVVQGGEASRYLAGELVNRLAEGN